MSNDCKIQDSPAKTLRDLSSIQENRFCFDCGQRCPTYVNISIGSFVCTGCGGALRKYNQRVKSISMSNFNSQEINFMKRRGNKTCGKIYLALCNGKEPDERENNFDNYLRLKYQVQKWYRSPDSQVEEEALKENEEALSRLSQNTTQKPNHVSVNAAAGLIIMNNRPAHNPLPKPASQSHSTVETSAISNPDDSAVSISTVSLQQHIPSLFSTVPVKETKPAADTTAVFDPFADFVAARPTKSVLQPSFFAQIAATAPTLNSSNLFQPVHPTHSFPAQSIPSASNDFFSTVNQPSQSAIAPPSSYLISSAFNPPPVSADKYAALAELDRMGRSTATKQQPSVSTANSSSAMVFGPVNSLQKNPFGPSSYNPFQTPAPDIGNPFATIQKNSATTAATSSLGQNSFNPFINAR
nr:Arf GTPase activating protein [Hymenolepis microstoma]